MVRLTHKTDDIALYVVLCTTGCTNAATTFYQFQAGSKSWSRHVPKNPACLIKCCVVPCVLRVTWLLASFPLVCKESAQDTRNTRTGFCTTICMCKSVKVLGIAHFPSLRYCIFAPAFDCQLLM